MVFGSLTGESFLTFFYVQCAGALVQRRASGDAAGLHDGVRTCDVLPHQEMLPEVVSVFVFATDSKAQHF